MSHRDQNPQWGDVYVNQDCIWCSACVAICPDVFDLDDEGKAFAACGIKKNNDVDDAISACPVNAIHYK